MEIKEEKLGEVKIVALHGSLDAATSGGAEKRLQSILAQGEQRLVVDMTGLTYISSMGLRVLIIVAKDLQQSGGRLALAGLSPHIHEVFRIAGFTRIFSIFPTPGEAAAAIQ
jgi:anti-anti-sigma factor